MEFISLLVGPDHTSTLSTYAEGVFYSSGSQLINIHPLMDIHVTTGKK